MKNIEIFNRVSFLDKLLFTKHLSIMLKSGIPLAESIDILHDQTRNESFKKVLKKVSTEIRNGQPLEKSLNQYPKIFDPLYRSIVSIGEESGTLETNLEYLSTQLAKVYEFRKKVQGALLYPGVVLTVAAIVGGGISLFVLPQLVDLFKSLDVQLPWTTQLLLGFATLMRTSGLLVLGSLGGLGLLGFYLLHTPFVKPTWHRFLLSMPIFGTFFQNAQIANFCRNLGIMLKSGLPISRALKVSADSADNMVYRDYISRLQIAVEHGKTMESELIDAKRYPFIPLLVSRMIGVGEKTGKLDETLLYLADFFEEEVDDMAKNLTTILEPLMLVVIALMVAFLAFSIISPIYQFTSSIKR